MGILHTVGVVLGYVLSVYLLLLIGRLIFEVIQSVARSWHPTGVLMVVAEAIYTITDPPLKLLRRFIPPLRLGSVSLDLSFTVLFLVVLVMIKLVALL